MLVAISFAFGCGSDSPSEVEDMPPSVTIQQPPAGGSSAEGSEVTLSATADDPEDGSLTSSIAWSSSLDGALGTGGSLNVTLSVGVHSITASVTDSEGQSATADVSHEITANLEPTVTIDAPADGSEVDGTMAVEFRGSASDPEDGDLTGSIAWSSSIDGALGTGAVLSTDLSEGMHTITATVSDANGNTASAEVTIDVVAPTPSTYVVELVRDGSSALHLVELTPGGTETLIGVLQTPAGDKKVLTDIAESPDGSLFGVSRTALYSVDAATATMTEIGPIGDPSVVGLAFDPAGALFGSTEDGNLLTVDPATGATTVVGAFGPGLVSDGDIAFSQTGQLWGSLLQGGTSVIATLDPTTGVATVLGPSGRPHIWALTAMGEMLYGFATNRNDINSLISIDTASGAATDIRSIDIITGGAGVSPRSGG